VIPKGAVASGTVAEAVPLGRFKGGASCRSPWILSRSTAISTTCRPQPL
jgi:hypothetical protein